MIFVIISLIVNLVISFIFANEGSNREVGSSKAFWYTFMLSPVIGAIVVFTSPIKKKEEKLIKEEIKIPTVLMSDGHILYIKDKECYRTTDEREFIAYSDAVVHQKTLKTLFVEKYFVLLLLLIGVTIVIISILYSSSPKVITNIEPTDTSNTWTVTPQ